MSNWLSQCDWWSCYDTRHVTDAWRTVCRNDADARYSACAMAACHFMSWWPTHAVTCPCQYLCLPFYAISIQLHDSTEMALSWDSIMKHQRPSLFSILYSKLSSPELHAFSLNSCFLYWNNLSMGVNEWYFSIGLAGSHWCSGATGVEQMVGSK